MSKILDAVSIVMTCDDEIFVIQRQNFLKAFPGYWAFPGGKVDLGDEKFNSGHSVVSHLDPRLFGAVVREAQEELGIDLREEISKGTVTSVDFLGLATTPDFNPYRFATYFFKINFNNKIVFTVDKNEAHVAEWMSAEKLLNQFNDGRILAVPPVVRVIEALGKDPKAIQVDDLNFEYDSNQFVPYIESIQGVIQFMPLSNTLPPAIRTNSFLVGDKKKILIDPSPKDAQEYKKFVHTLKLFKVDSILLTHHHPDHYEHSNILARELNIPILLSEYTHRRITKKDENYFQNVEINFLREGNKVTEWLGRDLLVMEIPGHDEGHIAVYPHDMSWFLAGDLFQGIGTVVIGGEEGDMKKYFHTLERIIRLSPRYIYPSHGIALGGTYILEKTLEHRKLREEQVLKLYNDGVSPEGMLGIIYAEVKRELWPYALENINKHIVKLKADGLI